MAKPIIRNLRKLSVLVSLLVLFSIALTNVPTSQAAVAPPTQARTNPYGPCERGGNCTMYAWDRWKELGHEMAYSFGNAKDWANSARTRGYAVGDIPALKSIIVFAPGAYGASRPNGHVAIIESISGNQITISEQNCNGGSRVVRRTFTLTSNRDNVDFIYFPAGGTRVQLSSNTTLSTTNPTRNQNVTARATLINTGNRAVTIQEFVVSVRLGSDWNGQQYNFTSETNITLQPGQTHQYSKTRSFPNTGNYFAEATIKLNGNWGGINNLLEQYPRVNFTVR